MKNSLPTNIVEIIMFRVFKPSFIKNNVLSFLRNVISILKIIENFISSRDLIFETKTTLSKLLLILNFFFFNLINFW